MPEIKWKMKQSMSLATVHSLLYRGEYKGVGVQFEIHTPIKVNENPYSADRFGDPETGLFIDGDQRVFKTQGELIAAIDAIDEVALARMRKERRR